MADNPGTTVVGPSILINGSLQGDEDLTVLGRVEGSISLTRTLHIEESGIVKADISVKNAVVSGVVVGNITASDSVELTEAGRMVGDIRAPRVIIVDGARFRGAVDMGDLETPRPTGPLPERKPSSGASRTARPAAGSAPRRPVTSPTRPTTPARASSPPKPSQPAAAAPKGDGAPAPETPAPPKGPVVAGKKLKKKVVVKKKA